MYWHGRAVVNGKAVVTELPEFTVQSLLDIVSRRNLSRLEPYGWFLAYDDENIVIVIYREDNKLKYTYVLTRRS